MISLFVLPTGFGLPSVSPFCAKTMVQLRLLGVEHKLASGNPQQAPTGKLPYIQHEGGYLGDSEAIQSFVEENYQVSLDRHLNDAQKVQSHLLRRLVEEHFYWAILFARWVSEAGWEKQKPAVNAFLPAPFRGWLPPVLRRGIRKASEAQGMGRHDAETIIRKASEDLDSIEASIQGPFVFGEELANIDVVLHCFMMNPLQCEHQNPLTDKIKSLPKLMKLVELVEERLRNAGGVNGPEK